MVVLPSPCGAVLAPFAGVTRNLSRNLPEGFYFKNETVLNFDDKRCMLRSNRSDRGRKLRFFKSHRALYLLRSRLAYS